MKKQIHRKRSRTSASTAKRLLSCLLVLTMVLSSINFGMAFTVYASEPELICNKSEHTHSADCMTKQLTCGQEESEEHSHSDSCYSESVTCGREEHSHTAECCKVSESSPSTSRDTAVDTQTVSQSESTETKVSEATVLEDQAHKIAVEIPEGAFPNGTDSSTLHLNIKEIKADEVKQYSAKLNKDPEHILRAWEIQILDPDSQALSIQKKIKIKMTLEKDEVPEDEIILIEDNGTFSSLKTKRIEASQNIEFETDKLLPILLFEVPAQSETADSGNAEESAPESESSETPEMTEAPEMALLGDASPENDTESDNEDVVTASGSCGTNATWKIVGDTLYIQGTGSMKSYSWSGSNVAPWKSYTSDGTVTNVVVGEEITSVGDYAFYNCSTIRQVQLPKSLTTLGTRAFRGCSALESVNLPENLTSIGTRAFQDCDALKTITLPNSLKSLPEYAFYSCDSLETIELPNELTNIGSYAFSECKNLKLENLPDSVTSIGTYAFQNCTSLESMKLPKNLTTIGQNAFYGCTSLKSVEMSDSITTIGIYAFQNCTALTEILMPDSVTTLGSYAFSGCIGLAKVVLPGKLTTLNSSVFSGCTSLTDVTLPKTLTTVKSYAFYNCTSLSEITIPDSVTGIESYAFQNCRGLTEIVLPDSVTTLGSYTFSGCTGLEKVVLPETLTTLSSSVFSGCTKLSDVTLPKTLTSIGSSAFYNCTSLADITIPDSVTSIGSNAFQNCTALKEVVVPDSVTTLSSSVFSGCTKLTDVVFSKTLTGIGSNAFYNCTSLSDITIPDSVTSIGSNAFQNCRALTEIVLPDSVTTLGSTAFSGCTGLKKAVLPGKLTTLNSYVFSGCTSLTDVTLPETLTSIGTYAFNNCTALTEIKIPDSVASIDNYAFYNCTKLKKVTLPEKLQKINFRAFYSDSSLLDITIPDGVEVIGEEAFYGTKITDVTLPTTLKTLGKNAFPSVLRELYFNAKQIESITAQSTYTGSTGGFTITIGTDVDVLPAAFANLLTSNVRSVVFDGPNQMTIESGAFASSSVKTSVVTDALKNLSGDIYADESGVLYQFDTDSKTATVVYLPPQTQSITIPSSISVKDSDGAKVECAVTAVGNHAATAANMLKKMTFEAPEQITEMAEYALADCLTLKEVNGERTIEDVLKTFTDSQNIPKTAFYNTGLTHSNDLDRDNPTGTSELSKVKDGQGIFNVRPHNTSDSPTLEQVDTDTGTKFELLTGDNLTLLVTADTSGATEFGEHRVYFECTSGQANLPFKPGETMTYDGIEVTCHETDIPYVYYYSFTVGQGETVSIPLTIQYPSPNSPGGGVRVWTAVVDQGTEEGSYIAPDEETIEAWWDTIADDYKISKSRYSASTTYSLSLKGDGKGGVTFDSSSFYYYITPSRITAQTDTTKTAYGKDIVRTMEYHDTLRLPKGIAWSDQVIEAVKNNTWRMEISNAGKTVSFYAGSTQIAMFYNLSYSPEYIDLDIDDDGNLTVAWRVRNNSSESQMTNDRIQTYYYTSGMTVDYDVYSAQEDKNVYNDVTLDATFHFADPVHREAQAKYIPVESPGNYTLYKGYNSYNGSYGGDSSWYIRLYNSGVSEVKLTGDSGTESAVITDTLPKDLYIPEANMEKMLREEPFGRYLTIEITGATLAEDADHAYGETVWTVDGTQSGELRPVNNNSAFRTTDLKISWEGEQIVVTEGDQKYVVTESLEQTLHDLGYDQISRDTVFKLSWDQSEYQNGILYGGENRRFNIYSYAKSTYQQNIDDWLEMHPTSQQRISNSAAFKNRSYSSYIYRSREAWINKYAYVDGKAVTAEDNVTPGSVIEYGLSYRQSVNSLSTLPMVDYLGGAQKLLVPKNENSHLADLGLPEVKDGGITYYELSKNGTYEKVWVGNSSQSGQLMMADNVVVGNENGTGETKITWYFKDLPNSYSTEVKYKVLFDTEGVSGNTYTLSNIVYMNDREKNRIYDTVYLHGVRVEFDKHILLEDGTLADYSTVKKGETVTYQLYVRNLGDAFTISGSDIHDDLPETKGSFSWIKGENIRIRYETKGGDFTYTEDMADWTLEEFEDPVTGEKRQRIVWPDSARINFKGPGNILYIYVELDFPDDGDIWTDYAAKVNARYLENTFYCFDFGKTVTHDLVMKTEALLQKGVNSTARRYYADVNSGANYIYMEGDRSKYSNRDENTHYVEYYVTLFNDGSTRLYLSTLYDQLPKGFTFNYLVTSRSGQSISNNGSSTTTAANEQLLNVSDRENVTVIRPNVKYSYNSSTNQIQFDLSSGSSSSNNKLSYDSVRNQYYLNPNEMLTFSYLANTNGRSQTDDAATNSVQMKYTDYLGDGVRVSDVEITAKDNSYTDGQNDGDCRVIAEKGDEYLYSEVTVTRDNAIPGITKTTVSSTYNNTTSPYSGYVRESAVVNWNVRMLNDGGQAIYKYTLVDEMEKPYTFDFDQPITLNAYMNSGGTDRKIGTASFTLTEAARSEQGADYQVYVRSPSTSGNETMHVRVYTNDAGNEVLELTHDSTSARLPIPGNGYIDMTVSTENLTSTRNNKVYTNIATLTPYVSFDQVADGRPIANEETGEYEKVESSSPVVVMFGFATSSIKRIHEVGNEENKTDSTQSTRYILLSEKDKIFRYTLEVNSPKDDDMASFLIIDSLPEIGDHSPYNESVHRNSQFEVSLADHPGFKVTITNRDTGETRELTKDQYTVEYETRTEFTDADWDGSAEWNSSQSADTRSIRIRVNDQDQTAVPKNSTVAVSFDAKITGDAQPGEIAWNMFGYRYEVNVGGTLIPLEAMPLEVGVKIPTIPKLTKNLHYQDGRVFRAEKDETFRFLIHDGEALKDYTNLTAESMADRNAALLTVTVEEGESTSGYIPLKNLHLWTLNQDGTWTETDKAWNWINNSRYTVVESEITDGFIFRKLGGTAKNSYTFTYNEDQERHIVCENATTLWDLKVTKVDADQPEKTLSGVVFGFYSPAEEDLISDTEYAKLGEKPEKQLTKDGTTWYLKEVVTTGEDGILFWEDLREDLYYLEEIKAADGYRLPEDGWYFAREDAVSGLYVKTITNLAGGAILPESGSTGILMFGRFGLLAMLAVVIFLLLYRRRQAYHMK